MLYRSKYHATLKRNFQIMPGAAWLKLLLHHVPDRSEHLVRYYGWYSNRSRGIRMAMALEDESPTSASVEVIADDTEFTQTARSAWARLINKVYEVDPLICPSCGGEMRFIAVIIRTPTLKQ